MRTIVCSVLIALGAVWLCVAGPVRPIRSEFFNPQQPSGPPRDPMAIQGQWFFDFNHPDPAKAEQVKSWEFHDDWYATNDESWTIKGVVTNIVYDGSPASNIVAFDVLATVYNNLPSDMPPTSSTNSHDEVQSPPYPSYAGPMLGTRIVAEFAIADMTKLPNGIPPYFTDPVSGGAYYIEALNEDEWAWYCWNPAEAGQRPGGPGDYQVPAWRLGDIPPGQSRQVLMQFQISGGVMSNMDYRHSVIRYSMENDADLLYNRHSSLKISHWLDTLLIDYGGYITAPPGQYEIEPPEYIYASNASVFFDPEMDFGDAPPPYPTLLINDGARHLIDPNVYLGKLIDAEPDGQPDPNALGDDNNNLADEDGVTFTSLLIPGQTASVHVECSVPGFLFAWIDYNGNGNWADPGEMVFSGQAVGPGINPLTFPVPPTAKLGTTFARFRFTTKQTALGFTGLAEDGEVEDYQVTIHELDFGDAWDCLSTPAYPTLLAHDGARHIIVPGVYLGAGVDSEPDGQPDFNALGDDQDLTFPAVGNIPYPPGDEDGVVIPSPLIAGATVTVQVTASVAGYLNAWIDWNANQSWADPGEHVYVNYALSPGVNHLTLTVPNPPNIVSGGPHSRWRFTTYAPVSPSFTGLETDGEVEDYEVTLQVLDFGDAPAPYPTLLVDDGARHMIPSGVWLGAVQPDHEPDGQPDPDALGDDNSGVDDEDGVTWVGSLIRGSNTTFNVVASTNGVLNAWIDFNQNGSWGDSGEQIANDMSLAAGTNALSVAVPSNAALGKTFGRFRFSSYKGLAPTGLAYDGEVEDYAFTIYQTGPSADIVITNITVDTSTDTVKIEWIGESPVLYETHYADVLSTSTAWTAWGGQVSTAPYEQTNAVPGQTSRFYRVVAPHTAP